VSGFARELTEAARRDGVAPRLVAERPEEWRLGRLTAVIDRTRGIAQLRFARLPVGRAPAEPTGLMAAWRRVLERLTAASIDPDALLGHLAGAYDALRARRSLPPGERVPLCDIADDVARAVGPRAYPRSQFAWDLVRLRAERRLVHDGRRIDLGVATGGAAIRRRTVVWIEDESGAGQYYRDFRMVPVPP
jgi:hypothetical protein